MNETESRIQEELIRLTKIVSELTGLTSHWNGDVELSQDSRASGRKPFTCRIILNKRIANQDVRWRTLIHEVLHSVSAGYNMTDYQSFLGWEEGVVEQTQRLLRPVVLGRLGLQIHKSVFTAVEAHYLFNKYIQAIELLREALHRDDDAQFYISLLGTDIKLRHNFLFGIGNQLSGKERIAFISVFFQVELHIEGRNTMNYSEFPERERILNQALKARTLPEIATAINELNLWIENHSDDFGILDAYEVLENMKEIAEFQQTEQSIRPLVKAAA